MYQIRFINPITGLRTSRYFYHYHNLEDYVKKFGCPLTYEVKDDYEDDYEVKFYPGSAYADLWDLVNVIYYELCKKNDD